MAFIPFPLANSTVVEAETRFWTKPWLQFVQAIWRTVGNGGAAVAQAPVLSPFTYTATARGTLFSNLGQLAVSRDAGVTWFNVGAVGGSAPLLAGDLARVTWAVPPIPTVVWFPTSAQ